MKKGIAFILILSFTLIVVACNKENEVVMELTKAKLTEQEENLIELLAVDTHAKIFDYTVDDTVKWVWINSYKLDENGNWQLVSGGENRISAKSGRIALDFHIIGEGMRIALQDDNGIHATSYTSNESMDTSNMTMAISSVNETIEIEYEKEIPLVIQVVTSQNGITSYNVDYFFQPQEYLNLDYEDVYAVTVTFSQEI